jgi:hypothetical protein
VIPEEIQSRVKQRIKKKFKKNLMFGFVEFYETELNELIKDNILRGLIQPLEWYNTGKTEYVRETVEEKTGNKVYGLFAWFIGNKYEILYKHRYEEDELFNYIAKTLHEKYPEELI